MGIEQICKTISNFFNNVRPPFPQLSRLLLVCSMIRRPGLSVIQSVANITKDLNKIGIPTGKNPAGCENMSLGYSYAYVNEIYRALKKDTSLQVGVAPGSLMITAFGSNSGGPIVVQGMNTSAGQGFGDIK